MSTIFLKTTNYKNFVSLKKFTHAHLFQIALKIMIVYANIFAFDGKNGNAQVTVCCMGCLIVSVLWYDIMNKQLVFSSATKAECSPILN